MQVIVLLGARLGATNRESDTLRLAYGGRWTPRRAEVAGEGGAASGRRAASDGGRRRQRARAGEGEEQAAAAGTGGGEREEEELVAASGACGRERTNWRRRAREAARGCGRWSEGTLWSAGPLNGLFFSLS